MRCALLLLAACGAPAAPIVKAPEHDLDSKPTPPRDLEPEITVADPIDPIVGLAVPDSDAELSWLTPGSARLEIAASPIETAPANGHAIAGTILDAQGRLVRIAIRLEHARFSLWMDRSRLFGLLKHEQEVRVADGVMFDDPKPVLFAGARVKRLARRDGFTKILHVGGVEIEGWVPDEAIADRGRVGAHAWRMPAGLKMLTILPGSVIHAKPEWSGAQIALTAASYYVHIVREVDPKWVEVTYEDGEARVRGYYQRFSAPGLTHRGRLDPDASPIPIAQNAKVASGSCLYSRVGGDAIGYIVGDRDVMLDAGTNGWWTLAIDTPWGPIEFAAHGPTAAELDVCAPPNSVPASMMTPPPSAP